MMVPGRWPLTGRDTELQAVAEALRDARSSCLVLAGAPGVGKSRLAAEAAGDAERDAYAVLRVLATSSASSLPLGAFSAILPDTTTAGSAIDDLLRNCERHLLEQAAGRPLLLLVDDAQYLDEISAALVLHMVIRRAAFVLETVRSGVPVPDATAALWKEQLGLRIDIGPLDPDQLGEALASALAGPVDGATARVLAHRAEGNMLFLTQLVDAALDQGALVCRGGLWHLTGPLEVPERLAELLEVRLGSLSDTERAVLEVIALGEPLGPAELTRWADEPMLASLESRGLVAVKTNRARTEFRLAHPMHGELLRARLSTLRTRAIAQLLADATQSTGAHRRGDVMRIGTWRLEAHDTSDCRLLTEAARIARLRFDLPLAERLALAAQDGGGGFRASLIAGESAIGMGRPEEGLKRLGRLTRGASGEHDLARLASIRIQTMVLWLGQLDDAVIVADRALSELSDPQLRAEVIAQRAMTKFAAGRPNDAIAALRAVVTDTSGLSLAIVAADLGYVLAQTGALHEALAWFDRSEREWALDPGTLPAPILWSRLVGRIQALLLLGRTSEAVDAAARGYGDALELEAAMGQAWMALMTAQARIAAGDPAAAIDAAREAVVLTPAAFLRRGARATLALALAQAGRPREAADVLADVDAEPMISATREVELMMALGWTAAAAGDPRAGRAALLRAIAIAGEQRTWAWGASAAHDLARLGFPGDALAPLTKLARRVDGPFVRARLAHVEALVAGDPGWLLGACDAFEGLGALLLAAESAADAAVVLAREGDQRAAAAAALRARELADRCGSPRTPALASLTARAALTNAEREIALLAAVGHPNREIAAERVISLRTVENTLRRVYMKLGIDRREQLRDALGLT